MYVDPLRSCLVKIDRATKHFNDLADSIKAFANRETYRIWIDEDSEPAIKIYRVRIVEDMPINWSGYIGDIIHNLRSALDCLATELVIRNNPSVTEEILRETYFPISWDGPGLTSNARRAAFFTRIGPRAEKIIKRLQPYRRGKGHPLWQLDQLDIADKHRRIIPARGAVTSIKFAIPLPEEGGPILPEYQPPFPLKDGDELCRVVFSEPQYNANVHFALEIAFNEPPVLVGEPMMPALGKFIHFVQRVVMIVGERCF